MTKNAPVFSRKKKRGGALNNAAFRSLFIRSHTKGCDETPTKYRI